MRGFGLRLSCVGFADFLDDTRVQLKCLPVSERDSCCILITINFYRGFEADSNDLSLCFVLPEVQVWPMSGSVGNLSGNNHTIYGKPHKIG